MEHEPRSRSVSKKMLKKAKLERSQNRSQSKAHKSLAMPRNESGINPNKREKVKKIVRLGQRKMNYAGKAGE